MLLIQMTNYKRGLKEMIVQEIIEDYTTRVKTYSNAGFMIRKKGTKELYSEAIDPRKFNREYEETDIKIGQKLDKETLKKLEQLG